jgi:hypothetical protein
MLAALAALCALSFRRQPPPPPPPPGGLASTALARPAGAAGEDWPAAMPPFPRWGPANVSLASFVSKLRAALDGTADAALPIQRVYVVRNFELLTVRTPLAPPLEARRADMAGLMLAALAALRREPRRYPGLARAAQGQGFVYAVDFGDARYCCRPDAPILTLAAPVLCNATIPIPTYDMIRQATLRTFRTRLYGAIYPWRIKRRVAVWRGSPTGPPGGDGRGEGYSSNPRARLVAAALGRPDLFDAALTSAGSEGWSENATASGLVGWHIPMYLFQLYRAILDVDGMSWSGRFGSLLCMSSVVLKVEPAHVDYFYPELRPWVHYIPVRSDLSDLVSKAEHALADANAGEVRRIIRNANDWCLRKFRTEAMADDLLRTWSEYVGYFGGGDPSGGADPAGEAAVAKLLGDYDFVPETSRRARGRRAGSGGRP